MPIAIVIGAIGDWLLVIAIGDHWRHLNGDNDAIKLRCHARPGSPTKERGTIGDDGVNSDNGDNGFIGSWLRLGFGHKY